MSKVSFGPLTPCPSPSWGEGRFFIRMRSAPPLPFRERGRGVRAARRPHDFAHALMIGAASVCACGGMVIPIPYHAQTRFGRVVSKQ